MPATMSWCFRPSGSARSVLSRRAPAAEFAGPGDAREGFTIALAIDLKPFEGEPVVLDIAGVLAVRLRQHNPQDRSRQNYPAFKMPDGSVPVLEATLALSSGDHPDWKSMTLGIPLALLKQPWGRHEVVLNFTGVRWTMYVDGRLADNDFPYGLPPWAEKNAWTLDAAFVRKAALHVPALQPEAQAPAKPIPAAHVQYWLPFGHNAWVGDVATCFFGGRYHVFYLYDRRHHQSKFGCGAHYFEHLSTADFKTWTEHEAATPLDAQWETIGTGVPFALGGKLCISYGLHTTRIFPREKTALPAQWAWLEKHGRTGTFKCFETPGMPAGSTYSVSTDGLEHFEKTHIMFHPCENPTVYTSPSGKLRLIANAGSRGIWESDSLDGGWRAVSPDFPPGGDCTFFFRWGRFDYIIGGFTGLWMKPADAPDAAYEDVVRKGLDFYDGSNVPSVVEVDGGRFLMAAWIPIRGWGGNLVIRELTQHPEGRIGSKWMDELVPPARRAAALAATASGEASFPVDQDAFLLTFKVCPSKAGAGRLGASFLPADGEAGSCEFQIRLDDRRAQFGPGSARGFAGQEKSLREGGGPSGVGNYAIENLIGADRSFTVRVIVRGCEKIGGTLIDAEIAGQRTMITYRPDLRVRRMVFRTEGVELRNIRMAPLKIQPLERLSGSRPSRSSTSTRA